MDSYREANQKGETKVYFIVDSSKSDICRAFIFFVGVKN